MKNEHTLKALQYRSGGLDDYSLGFVYNISSPTPDRRGLVDCTVSKLYNAVHSAPGICL